MADERKVLFVLRVFSGPHETHASALAHVAYACEAAGRDVRAAGGTKLTGKVLADQALEVGFWEYSPGELVTS
jgi:hypothetical protein